MSWVWNVQVQKWPKVKRPGPKSQGGGKTSRSKISRAKRPGPKKAGVKRQLNISVGETTWSKTSGSETSRSKNFGGESSWSRNVQVKKKSGDETSRPKMSGAKRPGPKCQWVKRPGSKCQGVKHPGPKCQGAKRLVQKVRWRNVLAWNVWVRKVQVRKHFLSLHLIIVKLLLWLWHSQRLLHDCEVLLLLSFKFNDSLIGLT